MESTKTISFDFNQICRFCLSQGGVMSAIFDDDGECNGLPLASKIMACASIQLRQDDGLPTLICHCCLQQVDLAYQFRRQCEEADATLREYLGVKSPEFTSKEEGTNGYVTSDLRYYNENRGSDGNQVCSTEEGNVPCVRLRLNGEEIVVAERDIASVLVVVDPKVPDYDANEKLLKKKKLLSKQTSPGAGSGLKSKGKLCKNGRPFQCNLCTKSFSQKAHLTRHQLVHTGKKPFACTVCSKTFADGSTLTTHHRMHTGERPYACDTCPKAFVSRSDLRKHSLIHSGVRPFVCPVCSKTFTRGTNLRKHARVHSGQRPYSCEQCTRTFSSKGDLARHVLIHSGHRPHVCLVCCVSFSRRDKLVRHMRRHQDDKTDEAKVEESLLGQHLGEFARLTDSLKMKGNEVEEGQVPGEPPANVKSPAPPGHRCTTCCKVFHQRRELLRHEKVHTGDKPFACELCPKRFSRRDKLTRHGKVHQGAQRRLEARIFHCDRCTASYYRKDKLLRHQRTHAAKAFPCGPCQVSFGSKVAYDKHVELRHLGTNGVLEEEDELYGLHVKDEPVPRFDDCPEPMLLAGTMQ